MPSVRLGSVAVAVLLSTTAARAFADEDADRAELQRLEAWLATKPASADISKAPEAPEAPPPPPRRHGLVVESGIGVQTQLGGLKHVSPTSPWFHLGVGYEPTRWLMLLAQGDVTPSSTSLANPPPDPRGYALFALSIGVRGTLELSHAIGVFAQGEIGGARVTDDVLSTYGFQDADTVHPYFGGLLGVEWYQVDPHLALGARGGVRSYGQLLDRNLGGETPIAWLASITLRYAF
jgi:hypothetical protein